MTEQEWRDGMGELVRESAQSEANKQYDGIKLTKARAQIYIT